MPPAINPHRSKAIFFAFVLNGLSLMTLVSFGFVRGPLTTLEIIGITLGSIFLHIVLPALLYGALLRYRYKYSWEKTSHFILSGLIVFFIALALGINEGLILLLG